jgi:hypothetical protein
MKIIALIIWTSMGFSSEIKQEVILNVNGKEIVALEGVPVIVNNIKISAKLSKHKTFVGSNYKFNVPSYYSVEIDESDKDCLSYIFNGKNVALEFYEIKAEKPGDDFIVSVLTKICRAYKIQKPDIIVADPLVIGAKSIPGKKVIMIIGESVIHKMYYPLKVGRQSLIIGLQRTDDKVDVDELNELTKMLSETFTENSK